MSKHFQLAFSTVTATSFKKWQLKETFTLNWEGMQSKTPT